MSERRGGDAWIRGLMDEAAERVLAGVVMTSFGGPEGGGSGTITRKPEELLADCEVVLAKLEGRMTTGESLPDYSGRPVIV